MKKILLMTALLIALPFSLSFAQVRAFSGIEYDSDLGFTSSYGSIQHLGSGIYAIERATIGEYGAIETDIALTVGISRTIRFGILGGPNADFIGTKGDGRPTVGYIIGATGFLISHTSPHHRLGWHISTKYKFALEGGNAYVDGWQTGGFLSYRFGD